MRGALDKAAARALLGTLEVAANGENQRRSASAATPSIGSLRACAPPLCNRGRAPARADHHAARHLGGAAPRLCPRRFGLRPRSRPSSSRPSPAASSSSPPFWTTSPTRLAARGAATPPRRSSRGSPRRSIATSSARALKRDLRCVCVISIEKRYFVQSANTSRRWWTDAPARPSRISVYYTGRTFSMLVHTSSGLTFASTRETTPVGS